MKSMDISNAYKLIVNKIEEWISTAIAMLPNFIVALLVLVVFYGLSRVLRRGITHALHTITVNKTITNLLEKITSVLVIGTGAFIALSILNLDGAVTSLLAGAGIIGLALGFAFQDIAANFMSGILLSLRQPFRIGDVIQTNDYYGKVEKLNLRSTLLNTPQGQTIYIPNKIVYDSPLENFTDNNKRRVDLACGVSYGDDLEKVKKVALDAVEGLDCLDDSEEVTLYFNEFGNSSINFHIRFWIDFDTPWQFASAQSAAIMSIKKAFDDHDIMIPFPIRTLDFGIRGGEKLNTMLDNQSTG
jgi:small-conductance mechanosensitive channel